MLCILAAQLCMSCCMSAHAAHGDACNPCVVLCVLQVGAPLHRSHGHLHLFRSHPGFRRIIFCLGEFFSSSSSRNASGATNSLEVGSRGFKMQTSNVKCHRADHDGRMYFKCTNNKPLRHKIRWDGLYFFHGEICLWCHITVSAVLKTQSNTFIHHP